MPYARFIDGGLLISAQGELIALLNVHGECVSLPRRHSINSSRLPILWETALYCYDLLLTLPREIRFIWTSRPSWVTVLFVIVRYPLLFNVVAIASMAYVRHDTWAHHSVSRERWIWMLYC